MAYVHRVTSSSQLKKYIYKEVHVSLKVFFQDSKSTPSSRYKLQRMHEGFPVPKERF